MNKNHIVYIKYPIITENSIVVGPLTEEHAHEVRGKIWQVGLNVTVEVIKMRESVEIKEIIDTLEKWGYTD